MRLWILVFAAGWLAPIAVAQPWSGVHNPAGVEISLKLVDPHPFRQGELIVMQMQPPEWTMGPPPPEQWQLQGLLLDPPAADCGSMAKPCTETGWMGGLRGGPPRDTYLNRWLPSLPPGHYRAALLEKKLVMTHRDVGGTTFGYADPPQYAVSNPVEFEIVKATPEWIRQTVAASVATLKLEPKAPESYGAQEKAAEQLRFLDTPEAWRASLAVFSQAERLLRQGLENTSEPASVCALMQSRIPAPDQAISSSYFWTLQTVCTRASLPPPPTPRAAARPLQARISATPPPAAALPPKDPALEAYFQKLRAFQNELWEKSTRALATSLPQKQAATKSGAFTALLEYVQQHHNPAPPWVPEVTREFIAWWPSVDVPSQRPMLDLFANTIHSPEVEPLLESVLDRWKPGDYYEAVHSAITELSDIDPRKARTRLLDELVKPQTWLDVQQLGLLPASAVPPMDDALIDALAASQRPPGWNPRLRMAAIAKYATPRALPRIKAIYESQQDPCQPELMAYFVRVDPAYADRVFHGHPWDMHSPPSSCTVQYFQRTPPLAMGAPIEKYMEAYLMHEMVFVKTTAAHQLGLYGSPAALGPLWDSLRYFHDWWKGKQPELEQNGEGVHLEVELRNAIARGANWLATDTDLRKLESLCTSRQCLGETQQDLATWQQPLRIDFAGPSGGWRARVAQYSDIRSPAPLEAKLAQFPRGTRFVLAADQADAAALERLQRFAAARGLVIVKQ